MQGPSSPGAADVSWWWESNAVRLSGTSFTGWPRAPLICVLFPPVSEESLPVWIGCFDEGGGLVVMQLILASDSDSFTILTTIILYHGLCGLEIHVWSFGQIKSDSHWQDWPAHGSWLTLEWHTQHWLSMCAHTPCPAFFCGDSAPRLTVLAGEAAPGWLCPASEVTSVLLVVKAAQSLCSSAMGHRATDCWDKYYKCSLEVYDGLNENDSGWTVCEGLGDVALLVQVWHGGGLWGFFFVVVFWAENI